MTLIPRELKLYPAFPQPCSQSDRTRRRQHHRVLQSVSRLTLAAVFFFTLSCSLVMASGSGLLWPQSAQSWLAGQSSGQPAASSQQPKGSSPAAPMVASAEAEAEEVMPSSTPTPEEDTWKVVQDRPVPEAQVGARAAIVVDYQTGEVLQQKAANQPMPMASLTKMMTALVVMERADLDDKITISARAAATPPTNLPLGAGEQLTVRELLLALMLTSANDAANALADGLGGQEAFVKAMNDKADELGLEQTRFAGPTGFDDPNQYSTAAELVVIAHELFAHHPFMREILQIPAAYVPPTAEHKQYHLMNFHPLVETYPGFVGGKPGFTGEAGMCLLTVAERDGKMVTAVVLNSPDIAMESAVLLDGGFAQLGE